MSGFDDDIIEIAEQHYILATSSRADDRNCVLKQGDTFGVFDRFGDVRAIGLGEQGVYHQGTRFLSQLELRLGKQRPMLLSSTVKQENDLLLVDLTNPDLAQNGTVVLPRGSLHMFRTTFLWQGACYFRLRITHFGSTSLPLTLMLRFGGDFADIFEVRGAKREERGQMLPAVLDRGTVRFGYRGLDGVERSTCVSCDPKPDTFAAHEVRYQLHLEPHETRAIYLTFRFETGVGARAASPYEAAYVRHAGELRTLAERQCAVSSANPHFTQWVKRSRADLDMMASSEEGLRYPYAGVPWFSTPFGRDGIITALQTLWIEPRMARDVLSFLAQHQATSLDPETEAEPGKILHELRRGEMAAMREVPFGHYYGSIDATPLFVMLAGAYHRRTGDLAFAEHLWPHVSRALEWIDRYGDRDGDGFVEYERRSPRGLQHQGWKDSHDAVFHRDGAPAEGPIALCEVQAYVFDAKLAGAELAEALGRDATASTLRAQAISLQTAFEEAFWCEELETYALALDGKKRPCRVRTSNPGHCLFCGIASPERAARVAKTLMNERGFSGWGIRTVADGEPRYNPMSYHNGSVWPHDTALAAAGFVRYGLSAPALEVFEALFEASVQFELQRLPELFCGFHRRPGEGPTRYPVACSPQAWASGAVFMLLGACLGADVRGGEHRLYLRRSQLTEALGRLTLEHLEVGGAVLALQFEWHPHDVGVTVLDRRGAAEVLVIK